MARDRYAREIDYLRISVTDRCNLRCVYCMPTHGLSFVPDETLLTAEEIERVARAAADLGFRKVRLTGGEPTLRRDVVDIVARLAAVSGIHEVAMTTNGLRLPELGRPLADAGLQRVNIHVDSLDAERLPGIMRWGDADQLWDGIRAAEDAGLLPIKINTVVARGYNEDDVVPLAELTLTHPWSVRFIELMPLGTGEEARVAIERLVTSAETRARIADALGALSPEPSDGPSDEARYHRLAGAEGRIGFISPVSAPYCGNCNRMRLTADGKLHLCLLHDDEIDVRQALREGASAADLSALLARAVADKPVGHDLDDGVHTRNRRMHAIGG